MAVLVVAAGARDVRPPRRLGNETARGGGRLQPVVVMLPSDGRTRPRSPPPPAMEPRLPKPKLQRSPAPDRPQPKAPSALDDQSASFKAHAMPIMNALDRSVGMLQDIDSLVPLLARLGARHVNYGAKPKHYDWVGSALISALRTALGASIVGPETVEAFTVVYRLVKHMMLRGIDSSLAMPALPTDEQANAVVRIWQMAKEQIGLEDTGILFFKLLFAQYPQALGLFVGFKHNEAPPPASSDEEDDYLPAPAESQSHGGESRVHGRKDPPQVLAAANPAERPRVCPVSGLSPRPQREADPSPAHHESDTRRDTTLQGSGVARSTQNASPSRSKRLSSLERKPAAADGTTRRSVKLVDQPTKPADETPDLEAQGAFENSRKMTQSTQQVLQKATRVTMNHASEEALALEIQRLAELEKQQQRWAWLTPLRLIPTLCILIGVFLSLNQSNLACWALYGGASSFRHSEMAIEDFCADNTGLALFLGGELVTATTTATAAQTPNYTEAPVVSALSADDVAAIAETVTNAVVAAMARSNIQDRTITSEEAPDSRLVQQQFDLNDAVANYLAVVGLIYALIFSQQYAGAISRQREIEDSLAQESGGIQICMNLVRVLDDRVCIFRAPIFQ